MTPPWDGRQLGAARESGHVHEWLVANDITVVHLGLFDASGTLRQKRLGVESAARALTEGWSFIDAVQWWGPADEVWRDGGSEHQSVELETASGRRYPFEAGAALFLGDFRGDLGEISPRYQLGRMALRAQEAGFDAVSGWEFECIVLKGSGDQVADLPAPTMPYNRCWSAQTLAADAEVIGALERSLEAGGIGIDHICAELGPGCLELALSHCEVSQAADDAALAKVFTKAFFSQRGETATFMAQLGDGFPGLGGHPSLSLHSTVDGKGALREDGGGALSKVALAAIAGVVELLPELLVMAAPNPNSYRRFGPGNWAPSTSSWGVGNYSCALRVVADHPGSARLELRIPGADTSPHVCAAMFLGAALWGIENGLEPPPPVVAPEDGRRQRDRVRLPRDVVEATERFTQSAAARELFGSAFVDHYASARLVEDRACHRFVSRQERLRYLQQV